VGGLWGRQRGEERLKGRAGEGGKGTEGLAGCCAWQGFAESAWCWKWHPWVWFCRFVWFWFLLSSCHGVGVLPVSMLSLSLLLLRVCCVPHHSPPYSTPSPTPNHQKRGPRETVLVYYP